MSSVANPGLRLFPPPFTVSLEEGFSPERDLFGRAPIARGLTNLFENIDQPLVLGLDGDWGTGKTTFLRFWAGELKKAGFPVVFFDAFENDYVDDPFTALAGEVFDLASSLVSRKDGAVKSFAEKATGAGKVILRSGIKIGIKAATMGAVNASDLDELSEAISDEAADAIDRNIGEMITRRRDDRNQIEEFKRSLSAISVKMGGASSGEKPLIFIIDELDRCRPAFALSLLERVKHFFSVENVHFVLGMNSVQLENSVKAIYGQGIDSRTYLQKFIHLNWTLSQRERNASDRSRSKYVRYLIQSLGLAGKDAETTKGAFQIIGAVAEQRELSFRTIERIMALVSLSVATTPSNNLRVAPLIGGLALMRVLDPPLFVKAKHGRLTFREVKDFFSFDQLADENEYNWEWAKNWWEYATNPAAPEELKDQMRRNLFDYSMRDGKDVLSYTAEIVMDDLALR